MNVLIASGDAVFARMMALEFMEHGVTCILTQDAEAIANALSDAKIAILDVGFIAGGTAKNAPSSCEVVAVGYPDEFSQISPAELTKYYVLVRPFSVEDFFLSIFGPVSEISRLDWRPHKKKSPADSIALDMALRAIYYKGEKVDLTPKEFDLFRMLYENRGNTVSREDAFSAVFHGEDNNTNVVDVYISYLRAKIDNRFQIKLIATVRGLGYRIAD